MREPPSWSAPALSVSSAQGPVVRGSSRARSPRMVGDPKSDHTRRGEEAVRPDAPGRHHPVHFCSPSAPAWHPRTQRAPCQHVPCSEIWSRKDSKASVIRGRPMFSAAPGGRARGTVPSGRHRKGRESRAGCAGPRPWPRAEELGRDLMCWVES